METIEVVGGVRLKGEVEVYGAKNAALKVLVAVLLAPGTHSLTNVPGIFDVELMLGLLKHVGCTYQREGRTITIDVPEELLPEAPLDIVRAMRASIIVLGPLLARCGRAEVALPGGDDIGARPIDWHLMALRAMGAEFELKHGVVHGVVDGRLKGAEIDLEFPSVGATENSLLGAVLAEGVTTIHNPAREPEIVDLCEQLNKMGAQITGAGTPEIKILGVDRLYPTEHEVVADRLEAGTFCVAAAITGGDVRILNCNPGHLRVELLKLAVIGCEIERGDDWLWVRGPDRPQPVDVATLPYPGFATDMQSQFVALLSRATGTSMITENLFDARFKYVGELARLGADITVDWQHAVVRGVPELSGCPVVANDIRAGATLVLAGLVADGKTTVQQVHHIERGYEDFVGRLSKLGADIRRARS